MKKMIALILALIFVTSVFAACNKSAGDVLSAVSGSSGTTSSTTALTESSALTETDETTTVDISDAVTTDSEETSEEEITEEETTGEETIKVETTTEQEETTEEETEFGGYEIPVRDPKEPLDILFIGNSFTYYNDLPKVIFKGICDSAGYDVTVDQVTKGAWNLYKFSAATDEMGAQVREKLNSKKYDVVVIQEQSATPVKNPAQFYTSVRRMHDLITANGAETVLYSTWGYHEDYSPLDSCGGSTVVMEMKLRAAYTAIGEELGLDVAYSGTAMLDVYKNSTLNVYDPDLHHSSKLGSTVSAYTIFAQIFGVDPRTVSYRGTLTESEAKIVREAAYKATFVDHRVLPTYKTSSVGVALKPSSDVDVSKTENLSALPKSSIISYVSRNSATTGNGWQPFKTDASKTFSGIRGTKDAIAAKYNKSTLNSLQKQDIADIGYGVSVIGVNALGADNAIENLVNGHWGTSYMANMTFDSYKYNIKGEKKNDGEFTALITLNFGSVHTFDAIGYMSGSMYGFPQVQKVYVSNDGVNWTLVESACYDAIQLEMEGNYLTDLGKSVADPWNSNKPVSSTFFDMNGVKGQYIRIGVIAGRSATGSALGIDLTAVQDINTREIVVFGSK